MKTAIQNGKIIMNTDTISVLENHSIVIENDIISKSVVVVQLHLCIKG